MNVGERWIQRCIGTQAANPNKPSAFQDQDVDGRIESGRSPFAWGLFLGSSWIVLWQLDPWALTALCPVTPCLTASDPHEPRRHEEGTQQTRQDVTQTQDLTINISTSLYSLKLDVKVFYC
jgi:hypothetical protein